MANEDGNDLTDGAELAIIAPEQIGRRIHSVRGQNVLLDSDLAELYGVDTRTLNQTVKRNGTRFPDDFMFQLTGEEAAVLISQSVISNAGRGGRRKPTYAFTEQGVAMLSSVLRSERRPGQHRHHAGLRRPARGFDAGRRSGAAHPDFGAEV